MPTVFEKTWQYDLNRAPSDYSTAAHLAQSQLWYWKACLMGNALAGGFTQGLWTCYGCSDGGGVNGDMTGTDYWGAAFNHTKFVRANEGVAHSWICLRSPAGMGPVYLVLNYASTSDYSINAYWSNTAPAGGNTTNMPTAADQIAHTVNQQITENAANPHRFHGLLATDGNFIFLNSKNGTGFFESFFVFQNMAETKAADTYKTAMYLGWSASGAFLVSTSANWSVASPAGVKLTVIIGAYFAWGGNKPATGDALTSAHPDSPIYVFNNSAGGWYLKGRLIDVRMAGVGLDCGTVEPNTGAPIVAMIVHDNSATDGKNFWIPANKGPLL